MGSRRRALDAHDRQRLPVALATALLVGPSEVRRYVAVPPAAGSVPRAAISVHGANHTCARSAASAVRYGGAGLGRVQARAGIHRHVPEHGRRAWTRPDATLV